MLDRETYEEAFQILWRKFTTVGLGDKCHNTQKGVMREALDGILDKANIEVEEPPVMPGISEGTWLPMPQYKEAKAFKVTVDGKGGIAYHLSELDAKFIAGSKEVTEKVIAWLESFGVHSSKNVIAIIKALENQGCNVDKFRGCGASTPGEVAPIPPVVGHSMERYDV